MNQCERCGRRLVPPMGRPDAPYLLVGDAPTQFDVRAGEPWTGHAGKLLFAELARVGIHRNHVRLTNLWLHRKHKDCEHHMDELLDEMHGREGILLMGADPVSIFTDENVSDVSGLRIDNISERAQEMLPILTYATFNPALALRDKLGEVRLGMQRFAEGVNDEQD